MAALLPDALWDLVEPFLPNPPRRPRAGRPRVPDRACLTGILFVLRSGIPWQMLVLRKKSIRGQIVVVETRVGEPVYDS
jgi:transposase